MKYLIIALLITPMLVSCGKEIVIQKEFVDVEVPVYVEFEKAPAQEPIELEVLQPSDKGNYDRIVKTILINNSIRDNKIKELEKTLDGYR